MRVFIISGAIAFCILNAPAPDARVVAALNDAVDFSQSQQDPAGEFYCPMHPNIRSADPGFCPRCGMKMADSIKDVVEYPVKLTLDPAIPPVSQPVRVTFGIEDPHTHRPVRSFEVVHEKLIHEFVVSQDLTFFVHTHPERQGDEDFHLDVRFPKPGMYRFLSDFYPSGATPQLIANTVMVPGAGFELKSPDLKADVGPQQSENSRVDLVSPPVTAGQSASMVFRVTPGDGIEPYLGAMAHVLVVSSDLIDMLHSHAFEAVAAKGTSSRDLNVTSIFPRAGIYRVWVQFQRKGAVNTAAFNVPVNVAR